ncbi:MAG: hypothetical protein BWY31_00147 [Lentisphaerae bacterium ADurb.Bin242]|nr:MAG: hypothetical protein BWY31_00147 [Lentisphaerae bacterium ADurb.Bin242]
MNAFRKMDPRMRYAFAAMLVAVSFLLLGAGRLGEGFSTRSEANARAKEEWREAAGKLCAGGVSREKGDWERIVKSHPEILLKAFHSDLKVQQE